MRLFLLSSILTILALTSQAQIENPVTWNFSVQKLADKKFEVHMTATIQSGWHVYSQKPGKGPEPTTFSFNKNPLIKLQGKVKEVGKVESKFDPNFNSTLRYYNNRVDFVQIVDLKSAVNTVLKGSLTFMVCNERKCLPPKEIPFSINIDGK